MCNITSKLACMTLAIAFVGCGGNSSSDGGIDARGSGGSAASTDNTGSGGIAGNVTGGSSAVSNGGAGGSTGAGSGGGSAMLLEFCNGAVQAMASTMARCWGGTEAYWSTIFSPTFDCQRVSADVAAGRMVYDQSRAAVCLSSINGGDCAITTSSSAEPGPAACANVLWGTVPAGQACSPNPMSNCVPEATCVQDGYACSGTCRTTVAANGSCQSVDGATSLPCAAGTHCILGVCLADAKEGQSCGGQSGAICASSLACVGATSSASGTCQAVALAVPCTTRSDCGSGVYGCLGPTGAKTCQHWKFTGESCTPGQGQCYPLLSCGADGKCTDQRATQNQPCRYDANGDSVWCASGLVCSGATSTAMGTCLPVKAPGDPCTLLDMCGGTQGRCDPSTQRCVACN